MDFLNWQLWDMRYVGGLEIFFHSKVDIKIKFSRFRQQKHSFGHLLNFLPWIRTSYVETLLRFWREETGFVTLSSTIEPSNIRSVIFSRGIPRVAYSRGHEVAFHSPFTWILSPRQPSAKRASIHFHPPNAKKRTLALASECSFLHVVAIALPLKRLSKCF